MPFSLSEIVEGVRARMANESMSERLERAEIDEGVS
jgi:hypothetical protein